MIDCCKGSFTYRSTAHVSSSIWTAQWSSHLVIRRALRLATIRAIEASDPMIHCSVWKRIPRSSGMWNCGAAMRAPGQVARNCWPAVFSPHLLTSENSVCEPTSDAGFGYGPVLDMLEARLAQYSVVARMTPSMKRALKGLRYEQMNPSWEIAEFEHHVHGWPQSRRCIVARKKIEESDPEPTLFTLERYAYRAWHTNLPLTPAGVWRFYDGRAGMERRIREIRESYALTKIPTRAFAANALYLEVIRLAYNLVTAFQRTCLPAEWQCFTLSKLRHKLFWVPGELTRPQNRPTLRLVNSPLITVWAEKILHRVHRLKPLEG